MADPFVHLHVHTEYSLLDGACRIKEYVSHIKEMGQSAAAITDHGVMYGVIDFYKECKKQGIKPIIGCEVYVARRTRFDKVHRIDVSPYHLAHVFREETGYTVKQYVLLKRVYHAKNLLVHSGMSVSEAAAAVGFNSTNNFIRAFKSSEGMTPGGFRKKFAGSPTAAADGPE